MTCRDIPPGVLTLGDLSGRTATLTVACSQCDRGGRASVHRLIAEHGADTPLPRSSPAWPQAVRAGLLRHGSIGATRTFLIWQRPSLDDLPAAAVRSRGA